MPPSRPTTPGSISDTSSDPGSLSDLDSGWTDLSSNRSVGGRHSPSTTSDAGDSEDARSAIDIYEGEPHEAWAGLTPEASELNIHEDTPFVESPLTAHPNPSSSQPAISDPALQDWVADALGSSLFSDNFSLELSTPHVSIRGSRALRLAFPDPLSNSEDNTLPSHTLSRTQSQSTEASSEPGVNRSARTVSSPTSSFTRTVSSDRSLSATDDDASHQDQSHGNYDLPCLELNPSSPISYALSVVLLGHPPLPHFKGFPDIPKGSSSTSIYEVSIHAQPREAHDVELDVSPTHRILMSDRTSGSSSVTSQADHSHCSSV
ncbi:hypothetical protein JB92DRAFT_2207083 [Gautieria morchelliformis]|nr:hypothetical protein JB92DRAFT_2207083 [Gautieria morchelliformis]